MTSVETKPVDTKKVPTIQFEREHQMALYADPLEVALAALRGKVAALRAQSCSAVDAVSRRHKTPLHDYAPEREIGRLSSSQQLVRSQLDPLYYRAALDFAAGEFRPAEALTELPFADSLARLLPTLAETPSGAVPANL